MRGVISVEVSSRLVAGKKEHQLPTIDATQHIANGCDCAIMSTGVCHKEQGRKREKKMETNQLPYENTDLSQIPMPPVAVRLTDAAAEMVKNAMQQESLEDHFLRIGVTGGGCSGLQYLLDFTAKSFSDDFISHQSGLKILLDPFSASHLMGTVVDYKETESGAGFKFENPNIARACGCGSAAPAGG